MRRSPLQQFQAWLAHVEELLDCNKKLTLVSVDERTLVTLGSLACQWSLNYLKQELSHLSLFLIGPLGAGKTRFSQAFIGTFTQNQGIEVESPTYAYMIPYENEAGVKLQHVDLYRLKSAQHLFELGLDERWQEPGLSLIEWPACAQELAPWPRMKLTIAYESSHTRNLTWEWDVAPGEKSKVPVD